MDAKIGITEENAIWDFVPRSRGENIIDMKWVFIVKFNSNGSINKYKARLVVKGYA